ncbi:MAG: cobalt ECF transporter T component CbiQ [candidate division FCPU426 bacterium]
MSGQLSLSDFLAVEEAQFGRHPRGLRLLDARLKLGLAVVLVSLNVLVANLELSLAVLALCWISLLWSRTPLRAALWFVLAPAWATFLVMMGFSLGFGHTPLASWHGITLYREGVILGVNAGVRVLAEMTCAAALVLSTPFAAILNALRWYKVPEVLVDTLGFMYRYLFLLWDEAATMRAAARTRGGYVNWKTGSITSGAVLAAMFLRAYDRAQRISQAVRARGGE